ncbi:glycine--tRNA ligase subunit beta [Liquorilactobacillus oeni]|uniref:Glycine--tRNA ligase beta subunit n=1 Tax=Liquorilactobacillus oeni DSM 19972 TaxID=1423777 RepID=A0A0R1M874_9LACO|nr:glycine--tRNA ligase subunit beta [Liquorilactobacillus oeni]KRL04316.1 glycyl-tRNA synthetase subunit beta [Liquorilactobacillus oeni DSM 19972]
MSHTFLLEIGLEEIPAHVVTPSAKQLAERLTAFFKEERLTFGTIVSFSTPRRLAVKVENLADKQADIEEEAKGPAKKIALDKDGNWSKAAIGFSRGQKMTPDDIFFKELKGVEYAYVKKFIAGKSAADILRNVSDVVSGMTFPTMMRWGHNDFKYVRPLRWLVALLDEDVIPFQILNIKSGRVSQGHRFLGKAVNLNDAASYPTVLKKQYVIADAQERKQMIEKQLEELSQKNNWKIVVDPELLEEVNNLVEYPTVFTGHFASKYLEIPDEVLITSMKDHQRFFYVLDKKGSLLPNFVSVRNGNSEHLENVVAGNEKVLTARLEDAAFFFHEDQKHSIKDYVERLKKVMLHDKIGTVYEKMERVRLLCKKFAGILKLSAPEEEALLRAAQIYKFDLVTGMIGEFSELQGIMGEKYALLQGENPAVATAIREHYLPVSAEGELPETVVGAVLAIADKLDSIMAFFAAGMVPTGSNDPYALRRQATGIVRILLSRKWNLSAADLTAAVRQNFEEEPALYEKIAPQKSTKNVEEFIVERIKKLLNALPYDYDVVEAVTAFTDNSFISITSDAEILQNHKNDSDFKETIEALTRVLRLSKKAAKKDLTAVDEKLFENQAERQLQESIVKVAAESKGKNNTEFYLLLKRLRPVINEYFEQTMVMTKDEKLQENRLSQLSQIAKLTARLGDLTKLNVK